MNDNDSNTLHLRSHEKFAVQLLFKKIETPMYFILAYMNQVLPLKRINSPNQFGQY